MGSPTVTNILHGPVIVYTAPVGESVPADSVAAGTAWGGNWARIGLTKAPLTAGYEFEEGEAMVEEALTAVKRWKTKEDLTLETTLAEITAEYLEMAWGGTNTTTAAGAGQVAKDELDLGGEATLEELAWGFEGIYTDSSGTEFPVRVFVHKATAKANGELEFGRESEFPGIPIQIKALADLGQSQGERLFKFQRVTAAAT